MCFYFCNYGKLVMADLLSVFIYHNDHVALYILFQEASEVKRKTAKRNFISEKDFLEFTLKYQQVLAERDSGSSFPLLLRALVLIFFGRIVVQNTYTSLLPDDVTKQV